MQILQPLRQAFKPLNQSEKSRCDSVRSRTSEGYLKTNGSEGVSNIMSGKAPEYKSVSQHRQTFSGALHQVRADESKQQSKQINAYCTINMSNLKAAD